MVVRNFNVVSVILCTQLAGCGTYSGPASGTSAPERPVNLNQACQQAYACDPDGRPLVSPVDIDPSLATGHAMPVLFGRPRSHLIGIEEVVRIGGTITPPVLPANLLPIEVNARADLQDNSRAVTVGDNTIASKVLVDLAQTTPIVVQVIPALSPMTIIPRIPLLSR